MPEGWSSAVRQYGSQEAERADGASRVCRRLSLQKQHRSMGKYHLNSGIHSQILAPRH
jgi:hypothetical protein